MLTLVFAFIVSVLIKILVRLVCYWVCLTCLSDTTGRIWSSSSPGCWGQGFFNLGAVSRASPIPTKTNKPWPGHHAWGQSRKNNTAKVNRVLQQSNKAAHRPNRLCSIKSLYMQTCTRILSLSPPPLKTTTTKKHSKLTDVCSILIYCIFRLEWVTTSSKSDSFYWFSLFGWFVSFNHF